MVDPWSVFFKSMYQVLLSWLTFVAAGTLSWSLPIHVFLLRTSMYMYVCLSSSSNKYYRFHSLVCDSWFELELSCSTWQGNKVIHWVVELWEIPKFTLGPNYNQDQAGMLKKLIPIHPQWFKALNPKILNPRF
jgi:hypothetical protein